MSRRAGRAAAIAGMAALAASAGLRAQSVARPSSFERSVGAALRSGGGSSRFHLDRAFEPRPAPADGAWIEPAPDAGGRLRKPLWVWIGAASAVAIVGSAYNAFQEDPRFPFHVTKEGWFGAGTYAGGADKVSHFVSYYGVTRLMYEADLALGAPPERALLIASGTSFLAGVATELGDGTNKYGFSWEDLAMDAAGAAAGYAVLRLGIQDLVGFRFGLVPAPDPERGGLGKDYSVEIYTADLKIAGLGERLHFRPGPARFLLVSATYGAKGYPYAPAELRQRQVGIELGINFREVLRALGVPRQRWYGVVLYTLFDILRIPYTAWGFRYDLNGKKWYGPDTGEQFPGGRRQSQRGHR